MTKFYVLIPLLAGALSVSAHAQPISVSVGYGDLDLTSAEGVSRLDRRINSAVKQVCGDTLGQKALTEVLATRKCRRETWADVASPRQIAISRARGEVRSASLADAGAPGVASIVVRR